MGEATPGAGADEAAVVAVAARLGPGVTVVRSPAPGALAARLGDHLGVPVAAGLRAPDEARLQRLAGGGDAHADDYLLARAEAFRAEGALPEHVDQLGLLAHAAEELRQARAAREQAAARVEALDADLVVLPDLLRAQGLHEDADPDDLADAGEALVAALERSRGAQARLGPRPRIEPDDLEAAVDAERDVAAVRTRRTEAVRTVLLLAPAAVAGFGVAWLVGAAGLVALLVAAVVAAATVVAVDQATASRLRAAERRLRLALWRAEAETVDEVVVRAGEAGRWRDQLGEVADADATLAAALTRWHEAAGPAAPSDADAVREVVAAIRRARETEAEEFDRHADLVAASATEREAEQRLGMLAAAVGVDPPGPDEPASAVVDRARRQARARLEARIALAETRVRARQHLGERTAPATRSDPTAAAGPWPPRLVLTVAVGSDDGAVGSDAAPAAPVAALEEWLAGVPDGATVVVVTDAPDANRWGYPCVDA